jgi:hypothetical protein
MRTRRTAAAALVLTFVLAGCANNVSSSGSSAEPASSASSAAPAPSSSDVIDLPTSPPIVGDSQKITGTVTEGVEPNCLILQDSTGSHLLVFSDPSLRSVAKVGAKITVLGKPNPKQMSTCQQGVPFIVSSVATAD